MFGAESKGTQGSNGRPGKWETSLALFKTDPSGMGQILLEGTLDFHVCLYTFNKVVGKKLLTFRLLDTKAKVVSQKFAWNRQI